MKNQFFFVFLLSILLAAIIPVLAPGKGQADFLAYWSAAALLARGESPYNPDAMWEMQQSAVPGLSSSEDLVLNAWNPPWLVLLMLPLGWLPFPLAAAIWMFCNLVLIGISLILSWQLTEPHREGRVVLVVFLAGYFFVQSIILVNMGQVTTLVLFGIVLALWWLGKNQDWLAGGALLLAIIKPHLSYFFILLLVIWVIQNRRWKVFGGLFIAGAVSVLIFFIVLPGWLGDYVQLVTHLPYQLTFTSTFGSLMAALFGTRIFNFSALLLLFLVRPLLRLVRKDGWLVTANFSLLLGVPFSPFGFLFDQVVLLPAVIQIISWIWKKEIRRPGAIILAAGIIMVNLGLLWMASLEGMNYYWFVWAPIATLMIYTISWKNRHATAA